MLDGTYTMLKAVLKLSGITAFVLILLTLGVVFARVNGFRQTNQVPPHPWFGRTTWDIRAVALDQLCATPPAPRADVIYVLPIRKTPAEWELTCPAGLGLKDFLGRTQHPDFLVEIEAGAGEDLDNLVDILNGSGPRRLAIHADSQRAARALRKKSPQWIFAADDASMLRLRMFTNLFLGPAIDFWPDFVLTGSDERNLLGEAEVAELKRRGKRVIWIEESAPPFAVDGSIAKVVSR